MPSIKTSAVLGHLATELRANASAAAGPDNLVSRRDQAALDPWLQDRADAMRAQTKGARITVDKLVDRAVDEASARWAAVNTRGPSYLSKPEIAAVAKADPALGVLTARAAATARGEIAAPPPPAPTPSVTATTATAGAELSQVGELLTVRVGPQVPINGEVIVAIDGHPIELRRSAQGLRVRQQDAGVPSGYGGELVSSGVGSDGRAEITLRITKDQAGWTHEGAALVAARKTLRDYIQHERVNDSDWQGSLGLTWPQAVSAGVLGDIAGFGGSQNAEVVRRPDSFVFVDRGPLDLYTEVTVNKTDGKVSNVYVEID